MAEQHAAHNSVFIFSFRSCFVRNHNSQKLLTLIIIIPVPCSMRWYFMWILLFIFRFNGIGWCHNIQLLILPNERTTQWKAGNATSKICQWLYFSSIFFLSSFSLSLSANGKKNVYAHMEYDDMTYGPWPMVILLFFFIWLPKIMTNPSPPTARTVISVP